MVDSGTFKRLSASEQNEYQSHSANFIGAVLKSDAYNGDDFKKKYLIQNSEGDWYLAKSENSAPFAGIKVSSKAIIQALLSDAVQNYGR